MLSSTLFDRSTFDSISFDSTIGPSVGAALTVLPPVGLTYFGGDPVAITATLQNSSANLTATLSPSSNSGTLSTTNPTSGNYFLYTPPAIGMGTPGPVTITITDTIDGLSGSTIVNVQPLGSIPDFLSTIRALLTTDTTLMATLPGGLWHLIVPPKMPNPCGVYLIPSSQQTNITDVAYEERGQLQISIYSPVSDDSDTISNYIADLLSNLPLQQRITWYNGRLQSLMQSNIPTPSDPTPGYGGSNILGSIRVYDYVFTGARAMGFLGQVL